MRQKWGGIGAISQRKAPFFCPLQPIQVKFTDPEEYKEAVLIELLLRHWEVIDIYICSVTSIDGEFKIGMKNFMVMWETEVGNIFEAKAPANSRATPKAPEASTASPEAKEMENEEAWASIFDAVATI